MLEKSAMTALLEQVLAELHKLPPDQQNATDDFISAFRVLPDAVKDQARKNYRLWRANPYHPSLHFKQIHRTEPLYSVRIGLGGAR
jgi:hypothetical protein